MKHDSNYEIKTLFDPLSKEWEGTSYEEKRILLVDSFKEYKKLKRNLALLGFISRIKANEISEEEYADEPQVVYKNLLLAVGFYLNKLIL